MPLDIDTPCTVYAPGGAAWAHPTLPWWAAWMRRQGYRGPVPRWAVRECLAVWPAPTCRCEMYQLVWLTGGTYASEETDEDGEESG